MNGVKNTNIFKKFLSYRELLKKCNSQEVEIETLKEIIKNDLFNTLIKNSDTEIQNVKLKSEVKHLKEKLKTLKEK